MQFVVTPGDKSGITMVKNDGGVSEAVAGPILLTGKGSSVTSQGQPTIDDAGTMHFTVNNTALNGLHNIPGSPQDTIKTTLNFAVTADGKVGLDAGGSRTAYPSLEVYAYGSDGAARPVYRKKESGHIDDLQRKDQAIPAVAPQ
jgi:hypothetical protein